MDRNVVQGGVAVQLAPAGRSARGSAGLYAVPRTDTMLTAPWICDGSLGWQPFLPENSPPHLPVRILAVALEKLTGCMSNRRSGSEQGLVKENFTPCAGTAATGPV